MRRALSWALVAALGVAALGVAVPAAAAEHDQDRPLEQASEESGLVRAPPNRHDVSGGELKVTPTELLAGRPGQKVRFSVQLEQRVPNAGRGSLHPRAAPGG